MRMRFRLNPARMPMRSGWASTPLTGPRAASAPRSVLRPPPAMRWQKNCDVRKRPPIEAALLLVRQVGKRLPLGRAFRQLVVFGGDPQQLQLLGIVTPQALGLRPGLLGAVPPVLWVFEKIVHRCPSIP